MLIQPENPDVQVGRTSGPLPVVLKIIDKPTGLTIVLPLREGDAKTIGAMLSSGGAIVTPQLGFERMDIPKKRKN